MRAHVSCVYACMHVYVYVLTHVVCMYVYNVYAMWCTAVFGGFAAPELAVRIKDAKPKVVLTASCGIEGTKIIPYKPLLDKAIELSADTHRVERVVVFQRPQAVASMQDGRDVDWEQAVNAAEPFTSCVPVRATDPSYILYTSGTTGRYHSGLRTRLLLNCSDTSFFNHCVVLAPSLFSSRRFAERCRA